MQIKIALFSAKPYDRQYFDSHNQKGFEIEYFESHLNPSNINLINGHQVVCVFVNDIANAEVIAHLAKVGVKFIALRCAGFNNVDLNACKTHGIKVARVPAYSPYAVAEHTVGLILTLNRKIHKAYNRVKDGNFALDGLMGFDLQGKTIGLIGMGKIGSITAKILQSFDTNILYHDVQPNADCDAKGMKFTSLDQLFKQSDIVSLHCPLNPYTKHLINEQSIDLMKNTVMIVNTSRGGLVDTKAVIHALKKKKIGSLALDVYEEEGDLFFEDMSAQVIDDDIFTRLLTFPNVLVTAHQAFFTHEALTQIASTTLRNIQLFFEAKENPNLL
jgi:D-lactate dehydrogenase